VLAHDVVDHALMRPTRPVLLRQAAHARHAQRAACRV
jgi:hypothetical protein